MIAEKIKELRLDDKNEPLEYQGDSKDEVGELIQQYNHMVSKLEDSKVQMIRLEREGAWREMARQVAHDIKNPLTTMKYDAATGTGFFQSGTSGGIPAQSHHQADRTN